MKKLIKLAAPLFAASLFMAGCNHTDAAIDEGMEDTKERITVQATIFPIVNFTEIIGGDYVDVTSVFPAGADSHTFEPTQQQMVEIARSDLFIHNGAGMEGFASRVESILADEDTRIVVASEGIPLITGSCNHDHGHSHSHDDDHNHDHDHSHSHDDDHNHDHDHSHSHDDDHNHDHNHSHSHDDNHSHDDDNSHGNNHDLDPHIWFDPMRAVTMAENIKNALIEEMPEKEAYFTENFEGLRADLKQLDADFKEVIENSELNTILVSHAAYGYWTERFGLQQIAVAGLSSADQPSQRELAAIINKAKEYNIDTILFETVSTPRVAEVVKQEAGLNMLRLHHIATVTSEDKEANRSYIDLMNENLEILRQVLNPSENQ